MASAFVASGRSRTRLHTFAPAFRISMVAVLMAATAAGLLATPSATSSAAVAVDGADLARLMRFMAVLKGGMALGAAAAVVWRLGAPVSLGRFMLYAGSGAFMMAGPGLIWGMAHIGLGAALLHGGLLATIVMLWRDPATSARLADTLSRRRRQPGGLSLLPLREKELRRGG